MSDAPHTVTTILSGSFGRTSAPPQIVKKNMYFLPQQRFYQTKTILRRISFIREYVQPRYGGRGAIHRARSAGTTAKSGAMNLSQQCRAIAVEDADRRSPLPSTGVYTSPVECS